MSDNPYRSPELKSKNVDLTDGADVLNRMRRQKPRATLVEVLVGFTAILMFWGLFYGHAVSAGYPSHALLVSVIVTAIVSVLGWLLARMLRLV